MVMRWAACVAVLFSAPAFAQSSGAILVLDRASLSSVREYVAADAVPSQLALPPNLIVTPTYRPVVESMLRHSPTFRRQCVRLAGEPRLTVHLKIDWPSSRANVRAQTRITRQRGGHLMAEIDIFPLDDDVELIAHEIEHVIEQLDDVDLPARAGMPDSGVRALSSDAVFETTRAVRVGRKVTGEVRASSGRK